MWEAGYKTAFIWLVSFYPWHSYSWDSHVTAKGATTSTEWKGHSELPTGTWNVVFFEHFKTCSAGFLLHSATSQKQSSAFNLSLNFVCHKKKRREWMRQGKGGNRERRKGRKPSTLCTRSHKNIHIHLSNPGSTWCIASINLSSYSRFQAVCVMWLHLL